MRVLGLDANFPLEITKDESPILGFPVDGQEETSYILVIKANRSGDNYDREEYVQLPEDGYSAHQYINDHPGDVAHIPCYTSEYVKKR